MIGYGCVVGWWGEFETNVVPWLGADQAVYASPPQLRGRPMVTLSGWASIAEAYNLILSMWCEAEADLDALVLLHSDLAITDPAFDAKILDALNLREDTGAVQDDGEIALVGVAGGGGCAGTSWWDCDPVGHQMLDTGLLDFGRRTGYVDVLEGSLLALSPWAVRHLRFDEDMPGFHGYDTICLRARAKGKLCYVADIDTHHHTYAGRFRSPQSAADWAEANRRSRE